MFECSYRKDRKKRKKKVLMCLGNGYKKKKERRKKWEFDLSFVGLQREDKEKKEIACFYLCNPIRYILEYL